MMRLIWLFLQSRSHATEWHDGQFAHDTHAPFSLGLSGKSVIALRDGFRCEADTLSENELA
jgi:hypothetical protein